MAESVQAVIYQLIYRSLFDRTSGGPLTVVQDILAHSERNNSRHRVTGFLLFDKTHFMQILEGDRTDVEAIFAGIEKDPRHSEVTVLHEGMTERRAFPEWSMGGVVKSPELAVLFTQYGWDELACQLPSGAHLIALAQDVAQLEQDRARTRGLSPR